MFSDLTEIWSPQKPFNQKDYISQVQAKTFCILQLHKQWESGLGDSI